MSKPPKRSLDLLHGHVDMTHGAGGLASAQLIDQLFRPAFAQGAAAPPDDCARLTMDMPPGARLAFSTDSYVITPPVFPGGDIGSLAVHGTVNDLAMGGARPAYLSAGFILEEGFPLALLKRIVTSMAAAANTAGVAVVTGDTKVVARGQADGIFINTSGVGVVPPGVEISPSLAQPGDVVLVSGSMGDHAIAVMAARGSLGFETSLTSDSAPLNGLVAAMLEAAPGGVKALRDPTRGGLAAALNEIALACGHGVLLDERAIPVKADVAGACELLGLDPLNCANEGKLVAICSRAAAPRILAAMKEHRLGRDAAVAGEIVADAQHFVRMRTQMGGERMIDWLAGEPLPRIC